MKNFDKKIIKILEFLHRNVYGVFLIITLYLSILSVIYEDKIFAICCVFFAVFLIVFNKFKDHVLVEEFVKKWL